MPPPPDPTSPALPGTPPTSYPAARPHRSASPPVLPALPGDPQTNPGQRRPKIAPERPRRRAPKSAPEWRWMSNCTPMTRQLPPGQKQVVRNPSEPSKVRSPHGIAYSATSPELARQHADGIGSDPPEQESGPNSAENPRNAPARGRWPTIHRGLSGSRTEPARSAKRCGNPPEPTIAPHRRDRGGLPQCPLRPDAVRCPNYSRCVRGSRPVAVAVRNPDDSASGAVPSESASPS